MSRFHLALSVLVLSTSLTAAAARADEPADRGAARAPAAAPLRVLAAGADAAGDGLILIAGDAANQGPRVYGVQNGKLMTLPSSASPATATRSSSTPCGPARSASTRWRAAR